MIIKILAAYVTTMCFAIYINVSKKEIVFSGLTGCIGWLVYIISSTYLDEIIYSNFFAAIAISTTAHILAKIRKNPVTIYQIAGMFPIVPGAGMYKTLYYIVNEDYSLSMKYLFETLQIAGGIAAAIVLVATFNNLLQKKQLA